MMYELVVCPEVNNYLLIHQFFSKLLQPAVLWSQIHFFAAAATSNSITVSLQQPPKPPQTKFPTTKTIYGIDKQWDGERRPSGPRGFTVLL